MPIRDRQGNLYQYSAPNPLMMTQNKWDKNNLIFYNMDFQEVRENSVPFSPSPVIERSNQEFSVVEEPAEEMRFVPNIPVVDEPRPEMIYEQPPTLKLDDETARKIEKMKVVCHCLPAEVTKYRDELYGAGHYRVVYGKKFKFPAVLIDHNDLNLKFWTNRELTSHSIIYPQLQTKRWWKVTEITMKSGGYLVSAISSDLTPDFSDG